jgi:hypothetical protein
LLGLAGMIACNSENAISTVSLEEVDVLPSIHGEVISSLISDSGVTRYRLQTKVWDMFSNDTEPYWYFPEGIYLEKFDSLFNIEGYIEADTAYYFEKKELWQLIGNVHVQNLTGDKFDTSELFWDQKEPAGSVNAIYTDSLVDIKFKNGNEVVSPGGFRSNQRMDDYRFYDNSVGLVIDENELNQPNDSIRKTELKE